MTVVGHKMLLAARVKARFVKMAAKKGNGTDRSQILDDVLDIIGLLMGCAIFLSFPWNYSPNKIGIAPNGLR